MTPIAQQLDQMHALAMQHYPDDEAARNSYLVRLLETRLMEFAAMLEKQEPHLKRVK